MVIYDGSNKSKSWLRIIEKCLLQRKVESKWLEWKPKGRTFNSFKILIELKFIENVF
jgi:hypothetical protein